MKDDRSAEKQRFDPADFPALREFLPAYLHEEFGEFYDSAAEAVKAFASEASGDEVYGVKKEWNAFRKSFAGRPLWEIQKALGSFNCAWMPQSEEELKAVDEILRQAEV